MEEKLKISSLLKSLIGTAGIFILGMLFSFTFNWAVTKFLPQNEVGHLQYYISIVTFAMVIMPLGYQSLAQREVLNLEMKGLKNLSRQAIIAVFLSSIIFCSFWYYGVTELEWLRGLSNFNGLLIAILIIPIYSLNIFFRAVLQGQNKIYSSILPDVLIRPLILLASLICIPLFGLTVSVTNILCVLLITIVGSLIFTALKSFKKITAKQIIHKNNWLKQALILLPIGLLSNVNERIDVVMVSKILGAEANAIYGIAFKFALFSGFGLVILNQVLIPHYANHFKNNPDVKLLREKIKPNVRLSFLLSLSVVLFLIVFGEHLLGWFGKSTEDYKIGYTTMIILAVGQLFNVALGSTGYILTMAKKESLVLISILVGILTNILLNYFLVPILEVEGAAIATSASMVTWNIMMLIFVKRKTGINPTII